MKGRQAIGCASRRCVIRMALLRRSARRTSCAQGDSDQVPRRLKALPGKGRLGDVVTTLCRPWGTRIKSPTSPGADAPGDDCCALRAGIWVEQARPSATEISVCKFRNRLFTTARRPSPATTTRNQRFARADLMMCLASDRLPRMPGRVPILSFEEDWGLWRDERVD